MIKRRDFLQNCRLGRNVVRLPGAVHRRSSICATGASGSETRFFPVPGPVPAFVKYLDPLPVVNVMPNTGKVNQYQIEISTIHAKAPPGFATDTSVGLRPGRFPAILARTDHRVLCKCAGYGEVDQQPP